MVPFNLFYKNCGSVLVYDFCAVAKGFLLTLKNRIFLSIFSHDDTM